MRKWNPYNATVDNDWVNDFSKEQRVPKWYARICLHIGLFITNVEYLIRGK
jgi:hypothetical protein